VFGPAEVFGDANWLRGGDPAYKVNIISACADRVVSNHLGTPVHTDRTYREYGGPIDTLLVAGSMGPRELHYESGFLDWLRLQSTRARRFGSICTGAFVLAKAGLLDGRRATTHWNWASELAQDHPRIAVDPHPIYVRDGSCYTSAGVTACIDLCRVGGRRFWQTSGSSNCTDDGCLSAASGRTIAIQRNPRSTNPREPAAG
jgi:transcriptional regulator GlxA family with amidase domain